MYDSFWGIPELDKKESIFTMPKPGEFWVLTLFYIWPGIFKKLELVFVARFCDFS
jgi:hypothetical protein